MCLWIILALLRIRQIIFSITLVFIISHPFIIEERIPYQPKFNGPINQSKVNKKIGIKKVELEKKQDKIKQYMVGSKK